MDNDVDAASDRQWAGLMVWFSFWLAVIAALQIVGTIVAGLSVRSRLPLGTSYKIGYSFLTNLDDFPVGLLLLAAVVLAALPALTGATLDGRQERISALTLAVAVTFGFLLMFMSILAVLARLRVMDLRGEDVTATVRWVLLNFGVRNVGLSLLAFVGALIMIRSRLDLGPVPPRAGEPPEPEPSVG